MRRGAVHCTVLELAVGLLASFAPGQDDQEKRGVKRLGGELASEQSIGYGRRHALVIGIDDYQNTAWPDLSGAVRDAEAVAQILVARFGFEQKRVQLLLNEGATKATMERVLVEWAADPVQVGKNDLFVFFFAGHGHTFQTPLGDNEGYLVASDSQAVEGSRGLSSLLSMETMQRVSRMIPAKHALFILDCCFSGLVKVRARPSVAPGLVDRARQVITAGSGKQTAQVIIPTGDPDACLAAPVALIGGGLNAS